MAAEPAFKLFDPNAPNDPSVVAAFQAVPDTMIAEIIDGELHALPRPARPHTKAASTLGGELYGPFSRGTGGPGGWEILFEPEIHFGQKPDIVVPDLAGWRRERMPDDAVASVAVAHYDVAPDWVCEVLSPDGQARDRIKKMRIYRREGVGHVWLVDPIARTLEVYRLDGERWIQVDTFEEDEVVHAEPFDAVEISLALLWGGPRPQ